MSPTQLTLGIVDDATWDEMRRLLREVVSYLGVKQVADELGTTPAHLVNALEERGGKHIQARWLPYLVRRSPNDTVVAFLAALRGLDVTPRKALTAAEKLERLDDVLKRSLGPDILNALYDSAYGKGR